MSRTNKFYPGWKMTWNQHAAYFNLLGQVYALPGILDTMTREDVRKSIHVRAFGSAISAKEIDHLKMFDAFKAECLALLHPADMEAQLHQADQPLIRLRVACRKLADEPYIQALVQSPRFKKQSLDDTDWTEEQLTELRNTLAARASSHHRKEKEEEPDDERVPF